MKNEIMLTKPSINANKPEWVKYLSQFMPRKKANESGMESRNDGLYLTGDWL